MNSHLNKGLFSNHYLEELLPREEEFKIPLSELGRVLEEIKRIWDKEYLSSLNEPQLRKHFLDKVFEILGWTIDVEPPTPSGEWSKHPDYALFHSKEDLKIAQKATREDYFRKSLCIGEAKRWGRPLDRKLKEEKDPFEVQNPSLQMSRYLWLTGVRWGILTDGKYFRLYERETSKRLDIFYEIDLEGLIENGSVENFKYFYLFFQRDAFPDFLEKVYKGSVDYAETVGEELKENVYQALKIVAEGFLKTPGNDLKESDLKEIHDNSLIFLYRLLFILYAEHRGLLPIGENRLYTESYSLDALKKEVAGRLDRSESIATSTHGYWDKLKELFEIVNLGNSELEVPPYNGGLFDPRKHQFLEKYRVGNLYVAKAVDLLSRSSDRAYIDYGSLEIRHLGSIYEGLLEYKLKIAEEDIVSVKEKGKEVFITLEEAKKAKKKIKEEEIIGEGEVYLVTDKGERKATGSYYTPDYIVNYIIENTLSPLIDRIKQEAILAKEIKNGARFLDDVFKEIVTEKGEEELKSLRTLWQLTKSDRERKDFLLNMLDGPQPTHKYEAIERVLQLKVLDPAMGSGHFLVEATTFLAAALIEALGESPEEVGEDEIRWARREVVERCIFGVDLNPLAVELAKLSLWLYTVAKGKPLNFLDHHLKAGNSLIGARLNELKRLPKEKDSLETFDAPTLTQDLARAVKAYLLLQKEPTETVEDVKSKAKILNNLNKMWLDSWRIVANLWTSTYFGMDLRGKVYRSICAPILEGKAPPTIWREKYLEPALEIAKEKHFFHWELEFPEAFYDEFGRLRENSGFDAVVGNPPYETSRSKGIQPETKEYLSLFPVAEDKYDYYWFFINKGNELIAQNRLFSMILPDTWLMKPLSINLRKYLLRNTRILSIDLLAFSVFEQVVPTCVLKTTKPMGQESKIIFRDEKFSEISAQFQSIYLKPPHFFINPFLTDELLKLEAKTKKQSYKLGDVFCEIYNGVQTGNDKKYLSNKLTSKLQKPILRGADLNRYSLWWSGTYILWLPDEMHSNQRESIYQHSPKILIRQTADRLIATIDREKNISLATTFVLIKDNNYKENEGYLVSILNSALLKYLYQGFNNETGRIQPQIKRVHIEPLPIRQISFVTPKQEREKLVKEAKRHHQRYLQTGKPDTLLYFVESRLIKKLKTDSEVVQKHNADLLNKDWQIPESAPWEQSDVVHDILAFLAEQMIEMNKEKQGEIKGFLGWLDSQLKIQPDEKGNMGIEALTGKTQIKNYLGDYHKGENHLNFEEFWKILERNKNRIQANLKSREFFETIKTEYEKSLSRLLPIKEKLHKTDWLIDQIVYKLYGLTEEEIRIV